MLSRIESLTPASPALWGKMTVAQMVKHCQVSLRMMLGEFESRRANFFLRLIAKLIKNGVVNGPKPLARNTPTIPEAVITESPDFAAERDRMRALFQKVVAQGRAGLAGKEHSFFGPMTPDEWGSLQMKHLDHHLRQFGA